jgi:hypothetical protein
VEVLKSLSPTTLRREKCFKISKQTIAVSADKKYLSANICATQQKVNRVQRDIRVENFNEFLRTEKISNLMMMGKVYHRTGISSIQCAKR